MQPYAPRSLFVVTWLLAALLAVVSLCGLVVPATYARETAALAIQGLGQDAFDLIVVLPALLSSLVGLRRRSRLAAHLWGALVLYLIYTFVIYAFSLYFNYAFLAYCAILGLAFYGALTFFAHGLGEVQARYGARPRVRLLAWFLIVIALLFGLLWLKEIVAALASGRLPASVEEQGLKTNAVHVLDLAFLLPGMVVTAVALLRRRTIGFVFGPVLALFVAIMALSLVALALAMQWKGQGNNWGLVGGSTLLAVAAVAVYAAFERAPKAPAP